MNKKILIIFIISFFTFIIKADEIDKKIFESIKNQLTNYELNYNPEREIDFNNKLQNAINDVLKFKFEKNFVLKNNFDKKIKIFELYDINQNYIIEDMPASRLWTYRAISCLIMLSILSEFEGSYNYLSNAEHYINKNDEYFELGDYYILIQILKIYIQAKNNNYQGLTNGMQADAYLLNNYGKKIENSKFEKLKIKNKNIIEILRLIENRVGKKFNF